MMLWRQINLLSKCRVGRPCCSPSLKIKLLETSKKTPHSCAFFIVSSNHQYSTLRNGNTSDADLLLNRKLLAASITSCGLLSTDIDAKAQSLYADPVSSRNYYAATEVADGSTSINSLGNIPAEPAVNPTGLPGSDHTETILSSSGDLSENLTLSSTDAASLLENAEVPLSALGLGGWTPVGMVQQFIELLHVQLDIPWWAAIVTATFIARLLLFPVLVKAQQNTATMSNYMPQLQALQQKFHKARCSGDPLAASKCAMEMQLYMKQHNISPFKSALIPLMQAPVFISFFLGLRAMAKLPVEALKTGGIWWLSDLTIPDPYYITPLVTCGTLYIVIKIGAESGVKMDHMKIARYVLTAFPILVLPFTIHFPAAVLCYWCTNNFFTLGAVAILKVPRIREALNIPKIKPVDPQFAIQKKGFFRGVKEAYDDQRVLSAVSERSRIDEIRFQKAGVGPIPRTYSYNPTKLRPAAAAAARKVQAKERKP